MTTAAAPPATGAHLPLIFQYTVEAYKTFQKLAEILPNPLSAGMFAMFATDERNLRDLLEILYARLETSRMPATLGADLRFQDMVEGDMNGRERTEFLISRERTIERKLIEAAREETGPGRHLLNYVAATKRAHVALLERELEMVKTFPDWQRREDAESLLVG